MPQNGCIFETRFTYFILIAKQFPDTVSGRIGNVVALGAVGNGFASMPMHTWHTHLWGGICTVQEALRSYCGTVGVTESKFLSTVSDVTVRSWMRSTMTAAANCATSTALVHVPPHKRWYSRISPGDLVVIDDFRRF